MNLFQMIALSPATGDNSPQKNIVVYCILGVAVVAAVVLGLLGKKK